jgi:regulator-associated protein of mTOR
MTAASIKQTSPASLLPNRSPSTTSKLSPTHGRRHHHVLARARPVTAAAMALRSDMNGYSTPVSETNGNTSRARTIASGRSTYDASVNGDDDARPSSAPGQRNGMPSAQTRDDMNPPRANRPAKPLLLRSKSDYAHRAMDEAEPLDDEILEWGARHGFEDHYQSEDIISQLANVS